MLKFIATLNNPRHRDPEWHFSHRLWTNKTRFAASAKCHRFLPTQRDLSRGKKQQKNNTIFQVNSLSTQHNLVLLQHRYSAPNKRSIPAPTGISVPTYERSVRPRSPVPTRRAAPPGTRRSNSRSAGPPTASCGPPTPQRL